ncbi:hypothetical protein DPMN_075522 [Dreissena polymorpha]|uniref:Uncharacterized protein n=1 Tax=Dreissena polymorpha TaxID=45954 RepID=A0A9D3YLV1_DREPO|nr:hypothetical protein DPMN_075522 [Dreissena polymorpha]
MQHVSQALKKCHYPKWALKKGSERASKPKSCTESKIVSGQMETRFTEHRRPSSTSSEVSRHKHDCKPDHTITMENVRILNRKPPWFERGVNEAIRALRPALNKNGAASNSRTPGTVMFDDPTGDI